MAGYATVWEFRVRTDRREEFERDYGPQGSWARLFRQAKGYIGTELLRDRSEPLRYLTIDRWASLEAYHAFHAEFAQAYAALDERCAELTTHEAALGEYDPAPDTP